MASSVNLDSCSEKNVLGRRMVGAIIDVLLVLLVTSWLFYLSYQVGLFELGFISYIFTASLFTVLLFSYTFLAEGWIGQTLGKIITRIKVVRKDGESCSYKASLLRNLLRIFPDGLFFYIVGFISIIFSEKYQRLGDHLADTVVVKIE